MKMQTATPSPGDLAQLAVHALCVFLCIPSLNENENPIRSETSVREKVHNVVELFPCTSLYS